MTKLENVNLQTVEEVYKALFKLIMAGKASYKFEILPDDYILPGRIDNIYINDTDKTVSIN